MISFILLMTIILSGCDFIYGVSHNVRIDYIIDHHCIKEALSQISEVREVEYRYEKGGIPITITGFKERDQLHYYRYKTSDINGYVLVQTDYEQKTLIHQTYINVNVKPPQEEIDIIRPVMKKIIASFGDTCGIQNIETIATESCNGVKCE